VAATTTHLRLGTDVTPLPRRRPQVLAQTLVTLDLLSQGRVILGAGLGGVPEEFTVFGEPGDARVRAAMLDEALEVLDRLMSGAAVTYHGAHFKVENVTLSPLPVQRPRIPLWVGGDSRPALRRAARWDGWVIGGVNEGCKMVTAPQTLADKLAIIHTYRTSVAPFDVAITGCSNPGETALAGEYAAVGATWWLESLFGLRGSVEEMLARVRGGPPG
jgi:alkanesulfonate monooxygenase SsuD/methylene tetrahydromethanopterin reductase-like flavin-dependent oxidoreductase (luciferase family)